MDPIFPPEIIEMIVEYNPSAWWRVDRWHARNSTARILDVIAKYTPTGHWTPLRSADIPDLLRLYVNMCRWDVFDPELVIRVIDLLMLRYNTHDYVFLFMAIGYHHATHIVNLLTRASYNLLNNYRIVHAQLEYARCDKTYNYRNDIVIELAATQPRAVDFIKKYIADFYTPMINHTYDKPYQFRDCISVDMGENIVLLHQQRLCDSPDFGIKTNSKIGLNLIQACCKIEMDKSKSLKKCVNLMKLKPGCSTHMTLAVFVYEYFVNTVIKYNLPL